MSITIYELAGSDDNRRFSPYCWRSKLALAHKGLKAKTELIRFTQKDKIAHSGSPTVPVIDDGEKTISDSFNIAVYLDEAYPDAPALLGSDIARGQAKFIETWTNTHIMGTLFRIIIMDVFNGLDEGDKAYFRETREKRFGMTLEQFEKNDDEQRAALAKALTPVRMMLSAQPFLSGAKPAYADYILMGCFMLARCGSDKKILEEDDAIHEWVDRMLGLYDGMCRKA
ncbi:MAG: glutathione S-transferase [Motiliproteus sp.]|jgi:glutathione S-transferase